MRRHGTRVLTLWLVTALAQSALAQPDGVQSRLLEQYALPLYWDNVEKAPVWPESAAFTYDASLGLHRIHLPPGGATEVRLESRAMVRVVKLTPQGIDTEGMQPSDLELSLSQGSGLFVSRPWQVASGTNPGLIAVPESDIPLVARIARPTTSEGPLDLALFLSRRAPLGEIAPYRDTLALPGSAVILRRGVEAGGERFWPMEPKTELRLPVQGPFRLAIEARQKMGESDPDPALSWRIKLRLNDRPLADLPMTSGTEDRTPLFVDGQEQVGSRLERAFVEIPPGDHELSVASDVPLWLRLLRQDLPDYLLPGLNGPSPSALEVRAQGEDETVQSWQTGRHLAQDNSHRSGGLVGISLLRQLVGSRPDYPALQSKANELAGLHLHYRDLPPAGRPGGQRRAYFLPQRLLAVDEQGVMTVLPTLLKGAYLERLGQGLFTALPSKGETGSASPFVQRYRLPKRSVSSHVRILLDHEGATGATLSAQMDDTPPVSLQWMDARPAQEMAPSPIEAALYLHAEQTGTRQPTLQGALPPGFIPAPLRSVGVATIPVPPGAKELRIWQKPDSPTPLWVAVQFQDSKPFALTPTDYVALTEGLAQQGMDLLSLSRGLLAQLDTPNDNALRESVRTLWHPLLRQIRAERDLLTASVTRPPKMEPQQADPPIYRSLLEQAARLERDGDWLNALALRHTAFGKASSLAEGLAGWLAEADNLFHLGESFIAEQKLKALLVHPEAAPLRQRVRDRLIRFYQQQQDDDSLRTLHAALFALYGEPADLRRLIPLLVANGDHDQALLAGLLLPPTQPLDEAMIRAALATGWIGLAEEMAATQPTGRGGFSWSNALSLRRQMDQGKLRPEEPALPEDPLRRSWRHGVGLTQNGPAFNPDGSGSWERDLDWVKKWATWQAERPGERSWRERPEWVVDYAQAGLQYAVAQDRHARAFRAEPTHPVRMQWVGPVRVRLEVRPQHPTITHPTPLDGWIELRDQQQLWAVPVLNNLPTTGVNLLGSDGFLGRKVVWEQTFGAGLHELTMASPLAPLWVRVLSATPDPDLAPLPELSLTTLAAALESRQSVGAQDLYTRFMDWLRPCASCVALVPNQGRARYIGGEQVRNTVNPTPLSSAALERAQSLLLALGREVKPSNLGRLAAKGDQAGLLQALEQERQTDPVERMGWLVWLSEQRPDWLERLLPKILALANDHPEHPTLLALAGRVERNTQWVPWNAVSGGAGVRQITLTDWSPESPALRLRRLQVAPLRMGERLLGNGQVMTMAFNSQKSLPITLTMRLEEVAMQPSVPLQVAVAVDEESPRLLTFEQGERNHPLTLSPGRHTVRVWMERGVVNQLLRLQILEDGQPLVIPQERSYWVATDQEPVTLHLAGPVWLRIDEWRSGQTLTRYQQSDGRQPLPLKPPPGQTEALYRVFVKQIAPQTIPTQPRWVETKPVPVPDTSVVVPSVSEPTTVQVTDALPLGGQEDGTWSLGVGWQQRRNSEAKASGAAERFVESRATWRFFDESARHWWQAGLLERIREQGNPTHGLFARIDHRSLYPPLHFFAEERLFGQDLDGLGMNWSSRLQAGLSQSRPLDPKLGHEWKGTLFWNHQAVDALPESLQGQVDQDLFSSYRRDHRYGVELADALRYRPWLDSELRVGAELATNEDYNLLDPDRLHWKTGWSQRVGPLLLEGGYAGNQYRADGDRAKPHTRQELELSVGFEQWQPGGQRLEWRFSGGNDLGDGKARAMLELTWHESGGRGYRDFRPGEVPFREQRERLGGEVLLNQAVSLPQQREKP